MATTKKTARDLSLDDLRYDVEVQSINSGLPATRVIGQLHKIEGPFSRDKHEGELMHLLVGPAADTDLVQIDADSEVIIDRVPSTRVMPV